LDDLAGAVAGNDVVELEALVHAIYLDSQREGAGGERDSHETVKTGLCEVSIIGERDRSSGTQRKLRALGADGRRTQQNSQGYYSSTLQ
jgi:hypothetical protein